MLYLERIQKREGDDFTRAKAFPIISKRQWGYMNSYLHEEPHPHLHLCCHQRPMGIPQPNGYHFSAHLCGSHDADAWSSKTVDADAGRWK